MTAPRKPRGKNGPRTKESTRPLMAAKNKKTVTDQLKGELVGTILRWGALAGSLTAIVIVMNYALPSFFRLYSSDPAPFEGKLEHTTDLGQKLMPITQSIQNAAEAAQKASAAATTAAMQAQIASLKEDQRDLCGLVDRLSAIEMRLTMTPGDQFFIDARADRKRDIDVLRARIRTSGQLPEC